MRPGREPRRERNTQPTGSRRGGDATPFIIVLALGMFAFVGFAAFAIIPSIVDDVDLNFDTFNDSSSTEPTEAPTVAARTATLAATPSPTPGLPAVNGSPFSLSTLEKAWHGKGLTLFSAGGAGGFRGTAVTPAAVRAEKGSEDASLAVLVYPNSQAIKQDWNLSAGAAPSPAEGRSIPAHESVWWNQNVVVVLISGSPAVGNEAKDAFLGL